MPIITLTTDFGSSDWYVGTLKGVVLTGSPESRIVDLCHEIPSGDIRAGAFALAAGAAFFPDGTVHIAVVDPGVGSERAALAIRTRRYFFVGPDNGLLSWALEHEQVQAVHRLENREYWLHPVSRTFHGRDIFAPVGAHLSRGVPLSELGPPIATYERIPWPRPMVGEEGVEGEVLYIDRFGNAISNVSADDCRAFDLGHAEVVLPGGQAVQTARFYREADINQPLALISSSGFLELAIRGGHAAHGLELSPGTRILLRRSDNK